MNLFYKTILYLLIFNFFDHFQHQMVHGYQLNNRDDDINKLIMKFRNNWEDPIGYLQKRGYLENSTNVEDRNSTNPEEIDDVEISNVPQLLLNDTETTTTESPGKKEDEAKVGVIQKIKNFWNNLIHPNATKSNTTMKNFEDLRDALSEYLAVEEKLRPNRNTNIIETQTPSNQTNPVPKLSICTKILKGFSHEDVEYLKKFVDCWKTNEENETITKIPVKTQDHNLNEKNITTGCHLIEVIPKDINPTKNSSYDEPGKIFSKLQTVVKFLAHLHHPVNQVGKGPYHSLNLQKVQALIDQAHGTLEDAKMTLNDNSGFKEKKDVSNLEFNEKAVQYLEPPYAENYLREKRQMITTKSKRSKKSRKNKKKKKSKSKNGKNKKKWFFGRRKRNSTNEAYFKIDKRNANDITKKINDAVANVQEILGGDLKRDQVDDYDEIGDEFVRDAGRKNKKSGKHKNEKPIKGQGFTEEDFSTDLKTIKTGVTPDQEEDINQFIKNLQEPPQVFKFDVDQFVKPKLTPHFITTVDDDSGGRTERTFFEFPTTPPTGCGRHKPDQLIVFDDNTKENIGTQNFNKRDILSQRIKAISNKMRMNSFLDQPYEEYSKINEQSKRGLVKKETVPDTDFIDHYYLLNDGTLKLTDDDLPIKEITPVIDPVDINIDLDLNKKFQELKFDSDKNFYAEERRRDAEERKLRENHENIDEYSNGFRYNDVAKTFGS